MCLRDLKTGPLVPPKNRLIITIKTTALIIITIIIIIITIIIIIIIKWHALYWNINFLKAKVFILFQVSTGSKQLYRNLSVKFISHLHM